MIERIASRLGRKDDKPNIELAELLSQPRKAGAIAEIVDWLSDDDPDVVSDCIKVLYEIGYRRPQALVPYCGRLLAGLASRNNRLVWGTCIALSTIAELCPDELYVEFDAIISVYRHGSVIAVDNCISILAGIAKGNRKYAKKISPLLLNHLSICRPKELAQHAERILPFVDAKTMQAFRGILEKRYDALSASQKKSISRLLNRL
jgi:hypothetical protein